MNDPSIPLAEQIQPQPERGPAPLALLGPDNLQHITYMAAMMMEGVLANTKETYDLEQFAFVAVRLSVNIMNEARQYRIQDGKAVRLNEVSNA